MKVSVRQLQCTLVLLLGPVDSPSGRTEANEMVVMRRSMLGSKWKAQFMVGERTYRTGNWLAGEGERSTAEAAKKNSQPKETMICNYLRVSVQFSADMKDGMEGGKAELSSEETCEERVKVFFILFRGVVIWEDFRMWISGWTRCKSTGVVLIRWRTHGKGAFNWMAFD